MSKMAGMENWGKIELVRFNDPDPNSANGTCSDAFWEIYDELFEEMFSRNNGTGFWYNRNVILEHYGKGNMYGLQVHETEEMFRNHEVENPIFLKRSFYMLPCFCCKIGDEADILWVAPRARKQGFGKKMVELLDVKEAHSLPETKGFWETCGVTLKT